MLPLIPGPLTGRCRNIGHLGFSGFHRDEAYAEVVKLVVLFRFSEVEYGFGYIIIRSPYTPYSIYLRGAIGSP